MKRIILMSTIIALSIGAMSAQSQQAGSSPRTPEQQATFRLQELQKNLSLDGAQSEKIKSLLVDYFTKRDALRAAKDNGGDLKPKFVQLNQQSEAAIKSVLTPEQAKKLDEYEQNRRAGAAKPRE